MSIVFILFFLRVQISLPDNKMGKSSALYTSLLKISGPNLVLKCCLEFPVFENSLLDLLNIPFIFIGNFAIEIFKILYL